MSFIRNGLTVSIAAFGLVGAMAIGCKASVSTGTEAAAPTASPVAATPPPPVDSDGDGIPDDKDACKDKAGKASDEADKNGCPEPAKLAMAPVQKVEIVGNEVKIKDKIMFDLGKSTIKPESDKLLDEIATVVKEKGGDIDLIEVGGHADKQGDDKANAKLTDARAKAVVEALVKRGVDAKKLRAKGYGEFCPEDTGDSPEAHEKNRRVQFAILKIKGKKTDIKLGCDAAAKAGIKPDPVL